MQLISVEYFKTFLLWYIIIFFGDSSWVEVEFNLQKSNFMFIRTVVVHFILLKSLVLNVVIFMVLPSLYYGT